MKSATTQGSYQAESHACGSPPSLQFHRRTYPTFARYTPVQAPQSNGTAESFVKTLRRDYVNLSVLTDANDILATLPDWIEDYCETHPHSGLRFLSPRELIRLSAQSTPPPVRPNGVHSIHGVKIGRACGPSIEAETQAIRRMRVNQ
jgi:transposase InsO family protein